MELKIIGEKKEVLAILNDLCYRYGKDTTIEELLKKMDREDLILL